MMGGSILLDSQVDVGSTFSFRIQLRPVKEHKIQEKAPQNKKDFSVQDSYLSVIRGEEM